MSHNSYPRPSTKSKIKEWRGADTRIPKGANRRIYVQKFYPKVTLRELEDFFGGRDLIDGIALYQQYAFIQFKEMKDFYHALSRDQEKWNDYFIDVRAYKMDPPKNHEHSRADLRRRSGSRERDLRESLSRRRRSRTRSRSRSPSRGRSRSPIRFKSPDLSRSLQRVQQHSDGWSNNCWSDPDRQQSQLDLQNAQAKFNAMMAEKSMILSRPNITQQAPSAIVPFSGTLPQDIELTLKLVLEHKTARSLSLIQIQNVINYLEQEKIGIRNNETIPVVPTAPQYMHMRPTFDYRQEPVDPAVLREHQPQATKEPLQIEDQPLAKEPATEQTLVNDQERDSAVFVPEGLNDTIQELKNSLFRD